MLPAIYAGRPEPVPFDGFVDSVWPMYCKVLESQSEYYLSTGELLGLCKCADVSVIISENRDGAYYALATHLPFPEKIVHTSIKNAELHFERLISASEYKMLLQRTSEAANKRLLSVSILNQKQCAQQIMNLLSISILNQRHGAHNMRNLLTAAVNMTAL